MSKISTAEIEIAIARYFNPRTHVIVPNVSWGAGLHECDLLILTKTGYAYEVEIKISKADLIKDKTKTHGHHSRRISKLWFAIPECLQPHIEHIPTRAGIFVVCEGGYCEEIRKPIPCYEEKWGAEERFNIARLGTMRIWTLKSTIIGLRRNCEELMESTKSKESA